MIEGDDLEIKHATFVKASADQVYNAFTTAEGLDAWFTKGAKVDPTPGGEILFRWRDWEPDRVTGEDGGPVLEAIPPERFVFQWHPEDASYATTVEVDFTQMATGTTVRLWEYGYLDPPTSRSCRLDCAAVWGEALTLLKVYIEHGVRY
jgi:uncharacterized protein YndB with AHSA1/START domain